MLFHLFQETGHLSRDCEKDGGVPCYNCGEVGHLSRDCTVSKAMLCYNCKKPGHLSKDCKETNGETSKMQVRNCVIHIFDFSSQCGFSGGLHMTASSLPGQLRISKQFQLFLSFDVEFWRKISSVFQAITRKLIRTVLWRAFVSFCRLFGPLQCI